MQNISNDNIQKSRKIILKEIGEDEKEASAEKGKAPVDFAFPKQNIIISEPADAKEKNQIKDFFKEKAIIENVIQDKESQAAKKRFVAAQSASSARKILTDPVVLRGMKKKAEVNKKVKNKTFADKHAGEQIYKRHKTQLAGVIKRSVFADKNETTDLRILG